jgi:hypothetical protein
MSKPGITAKTPHIMLHQTKIENIAKTTARSYWGTKNIVGASSSSIIDYDGNPALEITIFLTNELSPAKIPKDAAINPLPPTKS